MKHSPIIDRIGLAVLQARSEYLLSERELARLAGVSRATLHKLEQGSLVRPDLAIKIAAAVMVIDVYGKPPEPSTPWLVPLPSEKEEVWAA